MPTVPTMIDQRLVLVSFSVHSCCKSGSCISNYLSELGTYSINTTGCGPLMYRIVMTSMYAHFVMFLVVVIFEVSHINDLCDSLFIGNFKYQF